MTRAFTSILVGLFLLGPSVSMAAPPPPGDWRATIDAYLEHQLKDPYTAVKRVTREPRYGVLRLGFFSQPIGWLVCYEINAKNAYGAYTGLSPYLFRLDRDGVKQELHGDDIAPTIRGECELPADSATATPGANTEIPL